MSVDYNLLEKIRSMSIDEQAIFLGELINNGDSEDPVFKEVIRVMASELPIKALGKYFAYYPITEANFEKQKALFQSPKVLGNFFAKIPDDLKISCCKEAFQYQKSLETNTKAEINHLAFCLEHLGVYLDTHRVDNKVNTTRELNAICKDFLIILAKQDYCGFRGESYALGKLESSLDIMIDALKEAYGYKEKDGFKGLATLIYLNYVAPKEGYRYSFIDDLGRDVRTEREFAAISKRFLGPEVTQLFETKNADVYYLRGIHAMYVKDKRHSLKGETFPDYYYVPTIDENGNSTLKRISTAEMSPRELYEKYGVEANTPTPITPWYSVNIPTCLLKNQVPFSCLIGDPSSFIDLVLDDKIPREDRWRTSLQLLREKKTIAEMFGTDIFTIKHRLNLSKIIDFENYSTEQADKLKLAVELAKNYNPGGEDEIEQAYMAYNERVGEFAQNARVTAGGGVITRKNRFETTNGSAIGINYFNIPIEDPFCLPKMCEDSNDFVEAHRKELIEISSLYRKLLGYIEPCLTRVINSVDTKLPEKPIEFTEQLASFLDKDFTEEEIAKMCDFLNALNKNTNIVEAFPLIVEDYEIPSIDLLVLASICLDGGMDLFNAYYNTERENLGKRPKVKV